MEIRTHNEGKRVIVEINGIKDVHRIINGASNCTIRISRDDLEINSQHS